MPREVVIATLSARHRTIPVAADVFTMPVVLELPSRSVAIRDTSTWWR